MKLILQWAYDYIQPQAGDAHLGFNPLLLQTIILQTPHLMKKWVTQPRIGTFTHYQ
jgi:hypothetical protein